MNKELTGYREIKPEEFVTAENLLEEEGGFWMSVPIFALLTGADIDGQHTYDYHIRRLKNKWNCKCELSFEDWEHWENKKGNIITFFRRDPMEGASNPTEVMQLYRVSTKAPMPS